MSNEYLSVFTAGPVDCLSLGDIEETNAVIAFIKGEEPHVVPTTTYNAPVLYTGVFGELSTTYSNGYYLTCINTYLSDTSNNTLETYYSSPPHDMSTFDVPFNGNDSYTFVITDVPFDDLKTDNTLLNTAFVKAFGVQFVSNEEPISGYPPDNIWSEGRTFVTIRNNDTLEEIAKAYDLMNTSIYEETNNKYTLDFNILPYDNVWRIMHPNLLEINSDYFRIRRVEKRRTNSLMMSISCEHISYELNVPYDIWMSSEDREEMPDFPYEGTPTEILQEMLGGSRFTIGTVQLTDFVSFTSKPMGMRSMIIGLANEIGAEVKWDKFTVSLMARRGAIRDLSFEVGKNLLSMTEVYETQPNGSLVRSYDVDVIDLSLIETDGIQEEFYDIRLGDTVFLKDEQFDIDVQRRIVSYEFDPFRKELPRIQLGRVGKNITNVINDSSSSVPISNGGGSGGAVEEVVVDLVSYYDTIINPSADINDENNRVYLRPYYGEPVIVTGPTTLIAGLKVIGVASTSAILSGVIKMYENGEYVNLPNSEFFVTVTSGYNTIGIPFAFQYYFDTSGSSNFIDMHIQLFVSEGTFTIARNETKMYIKGKNIILETSTAS